MTIITSITISITIITSSIIITLIGEIVDLRLEAESGVKGSKSMSKP